MLIASGLAASDFGSSEVKLKTQRYRRGLDFEGFWNLSNNPCNRELCDNCFPGGMVRLGAIRNPCSNFLKRLDCCHDFSFRQQEFSRATSRVDSDLRAEIGLQ